MKVQFDLRPAEYLAIERKRHSFNFTRLLAMLLLLSFLACCGGYLALAFIETQTLSDEIESLESDVAELETSQAALTTKLNGLKNREAQLVKTLAIMQTEPPTLEVLDTIETYMEPGMGIDSIRFTPVTDRNSKKVSYTAIVDATALAEEQIISLTDGLTSSGLFSGVTMPSTKKDEKTGRVIFNLSLNLRPFGEGTPPGGQEGAFAGN